MTERPDTGPADAEARRKPETLRLVLIQIWVLIWLFGWALTSAGPLARRILFTVLAGLPFSVLLLGRPFAASGWRKLMVLLGPPALAYVVSPLVVDRLSPNWTLVFLLAFCFVVLGVRLVRRRLAKIDLP